MRQLCNQGGGIGLTQTFDPFGNLLSQAGSLSSHYGFAGEWADVMGLQHLRARYYSPIQGRFLNRDPFPGLLTTPASLNPYAYVLNNPVLYTDPSGEFLFLPLIAVALAGGALGGLGYYAIETYLSGDPCARWDWSDAALWGGAGLALGAVLGVSIYGGWWIGTQVGLWGTTAASGGVVAQQAVRQANSVWSSPPFQRGINIHQTLGQNLPQNFPTIDRFANGVATSIKTLDLGAPTYQNIATLSSKVQGYINQIATFQGAQWVQSQMITARELILAVPAGTGIPAQWAALKALQQYAVNLGVILNIVQVP